MNRFVSKTTSIISHIPAWLSTAVVAVAIAYLTLARFDIDPDDIPRVPHMDKIVHFIMFGGLCWIASLDYATHLRRESLAVMKAGRVATVSAVISSLAGASVEVAQGAMGIGRSADTADWLADTAGAVVGAIIAYYMIRSFAAGSSQS